MPSRCVPCDKLDFSRRLGCGETLESPPNIAAALDRTSEEVTLGSPKAKWKLSTGELQSMQDIFFSPTILRVPVKHEEQNICEQGERTIMRHDSEGSLSHTEQAELRWHRSGDSDMLALNRP